MVISASQSKRRPPACPSTDTASCSEGGHLEGTEQTTKQSHTDPESKVADVTPAVATRERPIKRRCPQGSAGRFTQSRTSGAAKRQRTVSDKGTASPPTISGTPELPIESDVETGVPESCCPICGEYARDHKDFVVEDSKGKKILAHLWKLGYSPEDIIGNIFRVCKTFQMPEYLKLEFIKEIGYTHMRVAEGVNSLLQMAGLLGRLCAKTASPAAS
ncbi:UNVERIFIED_CONTAM: hypothetical protein FKN15_000755 [Acipenser sinensis]